jgi:hypothetical protein
LTEKHPAYEMFNGPSGTGVYVLLLFWILVMVGRVFP